MDWTTTPKASQALGYTEDFLRDNIECGLLRAEQNPAAVKAGKRSKYRIYIDDLEHWLKVHLEWPADRIKGGMKNLGYDFRQLKLIERAA